MAKIKADSITSRLVYSSSAYDKFKFLDGNRDIDTAHVMKLKRSISKNNQSHLVPILVNSDFEILDGQHRFIACKEMNLPIFYIMGECGYDDISAINTASKTWSWLDWVKYWSVSGNDTATTLLRFSKAYNMSISQIVAFCNGGHQGGVKSSMLRKGTFTSSILDNLEERLAVFSQIVGLCDTITKNIVYSRSSINALRILLRVDDLDRGHLLSNLSKYHYKIHKCGTAEDYLQMYLSIYNFKKRYSLLAYVKKGSLFDVVVDSATIKDSSEDENEVHRY